MKWAQNEIDQLVFLRKQGMSYSLIGQNLNRSKSSCIAKGRDLKIDIPTHRIKKTYHVAYDNLPPVNKCHWGVGHSSWCGKDTLDGKSYCQEHYSMSIVQPQPKFDIAKIIKVASKCPVLPYYD
jgi:hypothetical protein